MIAPNLLAAYRDHRVTHFSPYNDRRAVHTATAKSALGQARHTLAAQLTREAWENADGYTCADCEAPSHPDDHAYDNGHVRIVCYMDQGCYDDLLGDSYDPRHNPEIKPEILANKRQLEIDRIDNDGVWGYVAEFWAGDDWEQIDSIWGFVGNDFETSGYAPDMMRAALDELNACQEEEARRLEATRPDMCL